MVTVASILRGASPGSGLGGASPGSGLVLGLRRGQALCSGGFAGVRPCVRCSGRAFSHWGASPGSGLGTGGLRRGQALCSVFRPSDASISRTVFRQTADWRWRRSARRTRLETLSVPVSPKVGPSWLSVSPVQRRHNHAAISRPAAELRNWAYCEASTPCREAVARASAVCGLTRSGRPAIAEAEEGTGRWAKKPPAERGRKCEKGRKMGAKPHKTVEKTPPPRYPASPVGLKSLSVRFQSCPVNRESRSRCVLLNGYVQLRK